VLYCLSHGAGFSFQLHHNIAYEVFARARGITWDEYQRSLQPQFPTLWSVITRDPMAVFERMVFNLYDHLRLDASNLLGRPVAFVVLCGLVLGLLTRTLRPLAVAWLAWAWLFLALLPAFYSERYSMVLLPMYAAFGALAIGSPRLALAVGAGRRVWLKPALALVAIGFAVAAAWRVQAHTIDQLPTEVLEVASTLRTLKQPGDRIIARKSHVAYHAGVEPLPFPFADSLPALAADAHRDHARWLYFSWPEAETRPALYYLLDTTGVVPGLTPRRVTAPHPAVLYEIGPEFGIVPGWMRNDTLVALHSLRARLLVDNGDYEACYNLALVERLLNDPVRAYRDAARAARLRPRSIDAQLLLAALAQERGDYAASIEAFRRVLAQDRTNTRAAIGLGWTLAMSGDVTGAASAWRPWVDAADDAATLRHMIDVFDAAGDAASATRARERLARPGAAR
jgi:tetratricopeptide (TPR) repeat protein